MVRLSANLGFLWTEHELPDAIRPGCAAGFEAVECHLPYDVEPSLVDAALHDTGLTMIGLNTRPGDRSAGDAGLAAVPGREEQARRDIDDAIVYAAAINCTNVHVMAGKASGEDARECFVANLAYATGKAATVGVAIVIEPINQRDIPDYFLSEVEAAVDIVTDVGADNLAVMFDCYHVQISQGDVLRRFEANLATIGHVQFAAVPSRQEPDAGELDYGWLLPKLYEVGYEGFVGAEYRPMTTTDDGLEWLTLFT